MRNLFQKIGQQTALAFGRLAGRALYDLEIEGRENLPPTREPMLVISNHFGWFDAPILTMHLPFQPAFLIATESQRKWWVRTFTQLFHGIPIWRGQVDRTALRRSVETLQSGLSVGVFPEGGINPELADRVAQGEQIPQMRGLLSRRNGILARAKPGVALLAVMSGVRILPTALIGSEQILENVQHYRRSKVTLRIGQPFGPLQVEESLPGHERRRRLDHFADMMMLRIARLFPPEQRGPYQERCEVAEKIEEKS